MSHRSVPYFLFGGGAMIAIIMEMLGQPSLIIARACTYLELNTPRSGRRIPRGCDHCVVYV
ncbi:MAG TPA: hypothetical protein VF783_12795 [Terriglobales bacterium]